MEDCKAQSWNYNQGIPSEPDNCAKVIHLLLDQLEKSGWSNKDVFGIHMAMEEALMNAIHHGNKCAPDKNVQVDIEISNTRFHARVTDQGCGFNPDELADPTDDQNLDKTSGRGVMLIKSFVDEVNYNEQGNSVELIKAKSQ